jgi:hypothetical protein
MIGTIGPRISLPGLVAGQITEMSNSGSFDAWHKTCFNALRRLRKQRIEEACHEIPDGELLSPGLDPVNRDWLVPQDQAPT